MASIIPGLEYDIFVSYRQKDNKGDRWVTEFVNSLKTELEATFKEEISIYFDENPHDGLLATHDVDGSLSEKLKCLIFIPIISQTYCDPKSFAWNKEFLVFKKLASEDRYGLKIKLQSGNVASRILPVRIHELDDQDKAVLEGELGPIRAIDFVFKSAGVNRPLLSREEHPQDNLNKTYYRDQINKVANAIKEICSNMSPSSRATVSSATNLKGNSPRPFARKLIGIAAAFVLAVAASLWVWYSFGKTTNATLPTKTSIAVIPFKNQNKTTDNEVICASLSEDILTQLASLPELRVPSPSSSRQHADSKESAKEIGAALHVRYLLEGSILANQDELKITAILTDTDNDEVIWTKSFTKPRKEYFSAQSDVANLVVSSLHINLRGKQTQFERVKTFDLTAYEIYKTGLHNLERGYIESMPTLNNVVPYFERALKLDSTLYPAYVSIANSYLFYNLYGRMSRNEAYPKIKKALEHCEKLNPDYGPLYTSYANFALEFDFDEVSFLKYNEKAIEFDPNNAMIYYNLGIYHWYKKDFAQSAKDFDKGIELSPDKQMDYFNWKVNGYWTGQYASAAAAFERHIQEFPDDERAKWELALVYIQLRQYQNAIDILHKRIRGTETNWALANAYWGLGDTTAYNRILNYHLQKIEKGEFVPPAIMGHIYLAGGKKDKACEWFEKQVESRDGGLFWLAMVKNDPRLKTLKDYPRYQQLLKRLPV
jgi:TolB-like protein/tetratricopeptide (TPR) repeat protein